MPSDGTSPSAVDPRLAPIFTVKAVVTRADALAAGMSDDELRRDCRLAVLHRVRRGVYVPGPEWQRADDLQRHVIEARAALEMAGDDAHLTGVTALVLHGVELHEPDLDAVRLHRTTGAGRREAGVRHGDGELPEEHRTSVGGLRCAGVAWALVDHARSSTLEQAVVAFDSALHRKLATEEEIREVAEGCRAWSGSRTVWQALRRCDGRSESVGESRARLVLHGLGLAPDDLQFSISTERGQVRVDFVWKDRRVVGEFDGKVKYDRLRGPGREAADVAWDERQRELAIERAGWVVVRITWADLYDLPRLRRRVLQAFERAAALHRV